MMDASSELLMSQATTLAMDRIPRMAKTDSIEKVREKAVEFESVFAAQMLKPMFEEISTDGLFGGGHAEGIYRSLMVQEFGKLIAERGGFGLADTVSAELLKAQEGANAASQAAAAQNKETAQ